MRIAFVHSFYSGDQPSGENAAVEAEVAALRRAGHEVGLFAARTDELRPAPTYTIRAAARVATGRGRNPAADIAGFDPDVVHIHNLFPNLGRSWVSELHTPVVHTLHNYRPVCANGLLLRDGAPCTRCPEGRPWSGLRFACYRGRRLATLPLTLATRRGPMADPVLATARRIVVLSDRQRAVYADAGVPAERMVVSPNFLPDHLDPGRQAGGRRERSGWLFVGRLSAEKGILELLQRWPDGERLRVIGDGPLKTEVERASVGRDVMVDGVLSRREVIGALRDATGLLFPSVWFEAAPLVYMEALAAGLPVIAFRPNAVADAVEHEETGVSLAWDGDLSAALAKVRDGRTALASRCRDVFEARYTEARYLERATSLYRQVTHRRSDL